jgi:hypothetical protein
MQRRKGGSAPRAASRRRERVLRAVLAIQAFRTGAEQRARGAAARQPPPRRVPAFYRLDHHFLSRPSMNPLWNVPGINLLERPVLIRVHRCSSVVNLFELR